MAKHPRKKQKLNDRKQATAPLGSKNGPRFEEKDEEEDFDDERPVVVVLKEGKHLSAKEVEREKRRGSYIVFVTISLHS